LRNSSIEVQKIEVESEYENSLRPEKLSDYIGQESLKSNLKVFISASQKRGESIDHSLIYGPPGLGKTTLARVIANEMGSTLKITSAPMIEKSGDLASLLTGLNEGETLFIDEIHRLSPAVEEILYSAMEDFRLDIVIGSGNSAQTVSIDLPKFTLIGATTKAGAVSSPLRDRFGIHLRLNFYTVSELSSVVERASEFLEKPIDGNASTAIAERSRGTPRIALRILRRVRDFSDFESEDRISYERAVSALDSLGINRLGFDSTDLQLLKSLVEAKGKPIGLKTLSAILNEDSETIEEVIEPYLISNGYMERTGKGRVATRKSYQTLLFESPIG
jgi:Holliday junction DNA helicase RuvB